MFTFIETPEEIDDLAKLATEIWNQHYSQYFDAEDLKKLIDVALSKEAILKKISLDYKYHFIVLNNKRVGYFAYQINNETDEMFIPKLYIQEDQRGQGLGKKVLKHLEGAAKIKNLQKLTLTVYLGNLAAIKAYEKWGFENLGLIDREFGNGLKFKDYKMEKVL